MTDTFKEFLSRLLTARGVVMALLAFVVVLDALYLTVGREELIAIVHWIGAQLGGGNA